MFANHFYFKMYLLTGTLINENYVTSSTRCGFINERSSISVILITLIQRFSTQGMYQNHPGSTVKKTQAGEPLPNPTESESVGIGPVSYMFK